MAAKIKLKLNNPRSVIEKHTAEQRAAMLAMVAEHVGEDAERIVPVDEGELRDSIDWEILSDGTAVVFATADHALHIELGTLKAPAQPYLRPAARRKRRLG